MIYSEKLLQEIDSVSNNIKTIAPSNTAKREFIPKNIAEAISASAIFYKIDISQADNPINEYKNLKIPYYPKDKNIIRLMNSPYKEIDSPMLDRNFNPFLPKNVYNLHQLKKLALQEGYNNNEITINDPYELLQLITITDTFYKGKSRTATNKKTAITFESIKKMSDWELVSYGIKGREMYVYAFSELLDTFTKYKNFQDPKSITNENFSDLAISKLLLILNQDLEMEDKDNHDIRINLIDTINRIKLISSEISPDVKNFLNIYNMSSDTLKDKIQEIMIIFRDLSMSMRGWKGHESFPISLAMVDDPLEVIEIVSKNIVKLEQKCKELGIIGKKFLNLPIVKYRDGIYITPMAEDDGITIADRLLIVKKGTKTSSCIRLTSNWFASTIYRYMKMVNFNPSFEIKELANIG